MNHWKTTANGILTAFALVAGPWSALLAALQAIYATVPGHGPANYIFAIAGAVLTCLAASARIWIGLLQNDAPPPDQMLVVTPPSTQPHEADAVPVLVPKSPGDVALPRDDQGRITQNPN
ncbi:MAG TPA: hypothetical protein VMQ76_02845 [Terracidiphilus sp.]|jgi:hypothetical protein|nr:hypothetical protein [Terracidiphilus sp.]